MKKKEGALAGIGWILLGLALVCSGCARPALLDRAISAQGGSLDRWTREADVRAYHAFPGLWHWEMAFRSPNRYRFTLRTTGPDQHYVYDGRTLRTFIGEAPLSRTRGAEAEAFASHARWMAVVTLTPLRGRGDVEVEEGAIEGDEPASARSLEVRFSDGARYVLGFDAEGRLVTARGPIEIPGVGQGELSAHFLDFRRVDGYELPFATRYQLNGEALFDEQVTRFVPQDPVLRDDDFQSPPPEE